MSEDAVEEDLLNSIDEVDNRIKNFRQRVRGRFGRCPSRGNAAQ